MKKLPKVYANSLNEVHNNSFVFYSADPSSLKETIDNDGNRNVEEQVEIKKLKGTSVNQKINEIFNSPSYIYKADVELTLDNEIVTKKIIGKNHRNLITMDNELIPIDTIRDIKYK